MKVVVCGKGGSGKTTVAVLLSRAFSRLGYRTYLLDADESNRLLYKMLGVSKAPKPLANFFGGKKGVFSAMRGAGGEKKELFSSEFEIEELPSSYVEEAGGVKLLQVGKILEPFEGCACPFGVLSQSFLKNLRLSREEVLVVDTEAGVEHFGRGLDGVADAILVVVDPSMDAIALAEEIKGFAEKMGVGVFGALINKAPSPEVEELLEEELRKRGVPVWGKLPLDQELFKAALSGNPLPADRHRELFESLAAKLLAQLL